LRDAGLAAFVAPSVSNAGVINATMGKVALASGETVTLDLYGDDLVEVAVPGNVADALVENSGSINANGGVVQITAAQAKDVVDNIINVSGIVDVSSRFDPGRQNRPLRRRCWQCYGFRYS
jgi:large exoprotein involved in heme utilization and adhesion